MTPAPVVPRASGGGDEVSQKRSGKIDPRAARKFFSIFVEFNKFRNLLRCVCLAQRHVRARAAPGAAPKTHMVFAPRVLLQSVPFPGRLELPTLRLTASRSSQLSYGSK